ncbi:MAG: amidohydrolase, partial [Planctomycetota bacterium]
AAILRRTLGAGAVGDAKPRMGGEDFACYGRAGVPICLIRLGSIRPDRLAELQRSQDGPPAAHSPFYYPDPEETLTTGIVAMTSLAIELMPVQP